jgi:hypothetical protein
LPCFAQAYLGLRQRRVAEAAELPMLARTIASGIGGNHRPVAAIPAKSGVGGEHTSGYRNLACYRNLA